MAFKSDRQRKAVMAKLNQGYVRSDVKPVLQPTGKNKNITNERKERIINIQNGKDLITMDLRTKQIRYLKNYKERGEIFFINLSNADVEGYNYLFKEDKRIFLNTLIEDVKSFLGLTIQYKNLKMAKLNKGGTRSDVKPVLQPTGKNKMALTSGWKTGKGIRRAFSKEDPRQVKFRNLAKKK